MSSGRKDRKSRISSAKQFTFFAASNEMKTLERTHDVFTDYQNSPFVACIYIFALPGSTNEFYRKQCISLKL